VKDGKAGRIHDVDGNEYIDHNLCFGALMPDTATCRGESRRTEIA